MTQDLSTATRLGILETEAGSRTQSEGSCIPRTGVIGVLMVKHNLEKCLIGTPGYIKKTGN